jgi:N-acetylglutamate synthase-like GNAT family acetyltransferase
MAVIRKATVKDVSDLSAKLSLLMEDKNSRAYRENVTNFGVPDEYVKKVFARETLIEAIASSRSTFCLALEGDEIAGFAQLSKIDEENTELDRIIIFPPRERRGLGTQLLSRAIVDEKERGTKSITVVAGKDEDPARRFCEKNGFNLVEETTISTPWGRELRVARYRLPLEPEPRRKNR